MVSASATAAGTVFLPLAGKAVRLIQNVSERGKNEISQLFAVAVLAIVGQFILVL